MYLLGHELSVASGVGFIALAGLAAEFGVVMLIYIDHAVQRIAAPMIGGMLSAPLLSLFVIPAAYRLVFRARRQEVDAVPAREGGAA